MILFLQPGLWFPFMILFPFLVSVYGFGFRLYIYFVFKNLVYNV